MDRAVDTDSASFSSEFTHWLPWVLATLAGAVATLFRFLLSSNDARLAEHKAEIERLKATCEHQQVQIDDCNVDRTELRVKVTGLEKDVEFLKSRVKA